MRCADNNGATFVPIVKDPPPPHHPVTPHRNHAEVTEAKSRRSVGDANRGFEPEKVQGKYLPCLVHWRLSPCTRADTQYFVLLFNELPKDNELLGWNLDPEVQMCTDRASCYNTC